ncbi:MAG: NAD(+) synthase [Candidatus Omnitrophica bacterium]|nr:NAD(+) synthase [Candidatus Omnitrophota bacterium]
MKAKVVNWIKCQLKDSGAKGIVLGLSGGIDSCVCAALAKEAAGKHKVLGLFLPCHSHAQDIKDAKLVAKKLGIKTKAVNLSLIYDCCLKILPKAGKLALANIRPRLRNKSELMAGYFTKYGDGGVDILPIGGLFKKDVRKLARELGIPEYFITKPPTAGLWPGQTDEGEMGITYNELDDILGRLEDSRKQISRKEKVDKVKRMIKRSGHKRGIPKVCKI